MFTKDIASETVAATLLKAQSVTATANGTGVDIQGYVGILVATAMISAATAGSSPTMDVKIQDSADNSSFSDVTGYTFTQVTSTDSLQSLSIDTRAVRRYVRVVVTIGGTSSPAFPMAISLRGYKQVV